MYAITLFSARKNFRIIHMYTIISQSNLFVFENFVNNRILDRVLYVYVARRTSHVARLTHMYN